MTKRPEYLFRDPSARVVWAAIEALDPASQHDVLEQLQERLAMAPRANGGQEASSEREARAIAALRQAADLLGQSPTVAQYEELRADETKWPAQSSIRRWLGGDWNTCLDRAHLAAVPNPLVPEQTTIPFSEEESITAMKEAARDLDEVPPFSSYLAWVRRPDVRRRPGRRPANQGTFERLFGGWLEALIAAELVEPDGTGAPLRSRCRRGGSQRLFDDDQLYEGLEGVMAYLGTNEVPASGVYMHARERMLDEEPKRELPSYPSLIRRLGPWKRLPGLLEEWRSKRRQEETPRGS